MANKEIKTEQAPAAIGPYSQGISAENIAILQQESLQVTTLQARHVSP